MVEIGSEPPLSPSEVIGRITTSTALANPSVFTGTVVFSRSEEGRRMLAKMLLNELIPDPVMRQKIIRDLANEQ